MLISARAEYNRILYIDNDGEDLEFGCPGENKILEVRCVAMLFFCFFLLKTGEESLPKSDVLWIGSIMKVMQ